MNLPTIERKGQRTSVWSYAPNGASFAQHFSYSTLVGFTYNGAKTVRENEWGPTTGRHLNYVDGGSAEARAARVGEVEMGRRYSAALELFGRDCAQAREVSQ